MAVRIGIGTVKGAWFASSEDRRAWTIEGPQLRGWEVTAFGRSPGGDHLLGTGSSWYGAAVQRSSDLRGWQQVVHGPAYPESSDHRLERIWCFTASGTRVYAGVAEAGLFSSDDDGETWAAVPGINEHSTRAAWQPGFGGLALHRILVDPRDPDRMWVAISAVGVFATEDGGSTWEPRNVGIEDTVPDETADIGYCVHSIVADPADADRIWRQDHRGIYRSEDGARSWERIEEGIPGSGFGFPIVRDRSTGDLFVIPLESDEYRMPVDGRLDVYRSSDDGSHWTPSSGGINRDPVYTGVLRGAMDTDGIDPGGIYFGTTSGEVWASSDTGASWNRLPATFPRITTVKVLET